MRECVHAGLGAAGDPHWLGLPLPKRRNVCYANSCMRIRVLLKIRHLQGHENLFYDFPLCNSLFIPDGPSWSSHFHLPPTNSPSPDPPHPHSLHGLAYSFSSSFGWLVGWLVGLVGTLFSILSWTIFSLISLPPNEKQPSMSFGDGRLNTANHGTSIME